MRTETYDHCILLRSGQRNLRNHVANKSISSLITGRSRTDKLNVSAADQRRVSSIEKAQIAVYQVRRATICECGLN